MSFIGLSRDESGAVTAQSASTLVGLRENPILAEFAAHYDREQRLVENAKPEEKSQ